MSVHLVLGAGGIGRAAALELVRRGHEVRLASRSGTDPRLSGVTPVTLDATDADAIARAATGAASIVNATNPSSYAHWDRDWPPVARAVLAAAERSGAGLVTVSNLYAHGRVDAPMTETTPLAPEGKKGTVRAWMWQEAYAAHLAGRVRATELRASDYFGPGAQPGMSYLNHYVIRAAAAGKTVRLPLGGPDVPHAWTYLADIGSLAAALAVDERSWGRPWLVPAGSARTIREVAAEAAELAGRPRPTVVRMPAAVMALARVSPMIRSLDETRHQFEAPFVVDSRVTEATFGLAPTAWATALAETVAAYADRASVTAA